MTKPKPCPDCGHMPSKREWVAHPDCPPPRIGGETYACECRCHDLADRALEMEDELKKLRTEDSDSGIEIVRSVESKVIFYHGLTYMRTRSDVWDYHCDCGISRRVTFDELLEELEQAYQEASDE